MCEIQFVMSHSINNTEITNFLEMLESGSYINQDATGLFTDNGTKWKFRTALYEIKDKKSSKLPDDIGANCTKFLVGHNRLATTGSEKLNKNNHPFETRNFMLVHNGIIGNHDLLKGQYKLQYEEETDSAIVPRLLELYLVKHKDIVKTIEEVAEVLSGSYSILLYYKPTKRLFYFKSSGTSFSFMKTIDKHGKIAVYGSTKDDNLLNCYEWDEDGMFQMDTLRKRAFATPEAGKVYELFQNTLKIDEVGSFLPLVANIYTYPRHNKAWTDYDYSHGNDYSSHGKYSVIPAVGTATKTAQKQEDERIEDDFEDFLTELSYVNFDNDVYEEVADADVQFYAASRSIVIKNLRASTCDLVGSYLEGVRKWNDHTCLIGDMNITIPYDSIQVFLETFSAEGKRTGAIK